eukprot:4554291-Prymnesium_polylepis.2
MSSPASDVPLDMRVGRPCCVVGGTVRLAARPAPGGTIAPPCCCLSAWSSWSSLVSHSSGICDKWGSVGVPGRERGEETLRVTAGDCGREDD